MAKLNDTNPNDSLFVGVGTLKLTIHFALFHPPQWVSFDDPCFIFFNFHGSHYLSDFSTIPAGWLFGISEASTSITAR